jgi:hypothetical protein
MFWSSRSQLCYPFQVGELLCNKLLNIFDMSYCEFSLPAHKQHQQKKTDYYDICNWLKFRTWKTRARLLIDVTPTIKLTACFLKNASFPPDTYI